MLSHKCSSLSQFMKLVSREYRIKTEMCRAGNHVLSKTVPIVCSFVLKWSRDVGWRQWCEPKYPPADLKDLRSGLLLSFSSTGAIKTLVAQLAYTIHSTLCGLILILLLDTDKPHVCFNNTETIWMAGVYCFIKMLFYRNKIVVLNEKPPQEILCGSSVIWKSLIKS